MRSFRVAIACAGFCWFQSVCFGQAVTSTDLIGRAKALDGQAVTYAGEVIGDVMKRPGGAWVNVNDGGNAIGVWMPSDMSAGISNTGDFKHAGDQIEISGILNRACGQHGGDLDIHAQSMQVLRAGGPVPCSIDKAKKDWAIKLLGAVAIIWILSLLKMR
jgi:hypothetical protein